MSWFVFMTGFEMVRSYSLQKNHGPGITRKFSKVHKSPTEKREATGRVASVNGDVASRCVGQRLVLRAIEVILGGVRHARLLPHGAAGGGGRDAARSVDALNVGRARKNAGTF